MPVSRVDLDKLRRDFLARLIADHEWLDFAGIPQVRNVIRLKLDDVFVPLSATRELPEGDALRAHRAAEGEADDATKLAEREAAERRVTLEDALKEPRLVVLGEPGSTALTRCRRQTAGAWTSSGPSSASRATSSTAASL